MLPGAATAATSSIEFDYQDGIDGRPLAPQLFDFDPEQFFLADEGLDFPLVPVRAGTGELARFGFNRLIEAEGKAIAGDFVTIIQHPGGEKKQVALRRKSGCRPTASVPPLRDGHKAGFVGLAGLQRPTRGGGAPPRKRPDPGPRRTGGIVNEGIRVSQLLRFIRDQRLSASEEALADRLFGLNEMGPREAQATHASRVEAPRGPTARRGVDAEVRRLTPLEITVRAGEASVVVPAASQEGITIDPAYPHRLGYDPVFSDRDSECRCRRCQQSSLRSPRPTARRQVGLATSCRRGHREIR